MSSISNRSKYESRDLSGTVFLVSGDGEIIKLPMPSQSSRDPLNWSSLKRLGAAFSLVWFTVIVLILLQGASLLYAGLSEEFSPADMVPLTTDLLLSGPTVFVGIGALLWIPLSLAIGRRPSFLLATLLLSIATLWAGLTDDFKQLFTALCFVGLAAGYASSVAMLIIIDLTFIHQRPKAIAMFLALSSFVTLLVVALIPQMTSEGTNRKLFYRIWTIPCVLSIFFTFFCFPETYFIRPARAFNGRILTQSATEKTALYENWDEVPDAEKESLETSTSPTWCFMRDEYRIFSKTKAGWKGMASCYPQVLLCLLNPLIFWVAILEALVFASMVSFGTTYTIALAFPPYSLPPDDIAFVNLAAAFGSLPAWPVAGYLTSYVTRALAIRNKGIREAEHYLPAFILPVVSVVVSNFVYGGALQHSLPISVIYFAYALNAFGFTCLLTANVLWVTEAFPRWAGPAIVVVNGVSFAASFGMSYTIPPWVKSQGIEGMQWELAGMILVVGCLGVPFTFVGKRVRQVIDGRWAVSEAGALRPH